MPSSGPIVIGASLSLSGDFSARRQAFKQGYKLWAADVRTPRAGCSATRSSLDIISDASSPTQVVTNYQTLISSDHVNLTFGPFSSLLTAAGGASVVDRYGYAMVEGAGGAPSVFAPSCPNVFDVALPVANSLVPFAKWVSSLPKAQRPTTAAYVDQQRPVHRAPDPGRRRRS